MDRLRQPRRYGTAIVTMSKRRIVDAHHHLWDLGACHYPWLMESGIKRFFGDPAPIQRNYLVDEFKKDASAYDLAASVHIQVGVAAGDEVHESRWLDATADRNGLPSAIVAFCDLSSPDAQRVIAEQCQVTRVRGFRHIVGRSAKEDAATGSDTLLENPVWISNLGSLREKGLSFDLQIIPQQVDRIMRVLRKVPGLRVAVCHCGSPWDQSVSGLKRWREGLARLASIPDVHCKISGLSMFNHDWRVDDIASIVRACIDTFGPERCMFGSNFPVDKLHKSYEEIWQAYEELAAEYSAQEQESLFFTAAESFYRLRA